MVRRGFVPLVAIIALALVAIFSGTVAVAWRTTLLDSYLPQSFKEFFGKSSTDENVTPVTFNTNEPSSQDPETATENLTKDWNTYTNTELGFLFKYPRDWGKGSVQTGIVSLESRDGLVELGVYKDFQGGFEHWSYVETKNYYTMNELWVPVTVMYGEEDPNEVMAFGGPYDMQPNLSFLYLFNKIDYPDGLGTLELIWSTFKLL